MMEMIISYTNAENHRGKICLSEEDTRTVKNVWDVKKVLEDKLLAPACDQKLFYQGRRLENEMILNELYLRSGDELQMEYLASGDLEHISNLTVLMEEFLDEMKELGFQDEESEEIQITEQILSRSPDSYYTELMIAMEDVGFECFIPWKCLKTQAHHHFFVQIGGFNNFMKVLRFSRKTFTVSGIDSEESSEISFDFLSLVTEWNSSQIQLWLKCLSLLWNFSETAENRLLLLEQGGLNDVMDALIKNAPHHSLMLDVLEQHRFQDVFCLALNEVAVGCLVQYVEFSKAQEIVVDNEAVVNKLLLMARPSQGYTLYTTQIAANTLFCCSGSPSTPATIAKHCLHREVIRLMQQQLYDDELGDIALQYFFCMFLGQIRACSQALISDEEKAQIDEVLEKFLDKYDPKNVADFEMEHSYVWISMLPFVHLAFAGGSLSKREEKRMNIDCSSNNLESTEMNFECDGAIGVPLNISPTCSVPLQRSELLIQSGGVYEDSTLYVSIPEDAQVVQEHSQLKRSVNNQQFSVSCSSSNFRPLESRDTLHWPGSILTQRIGVFAILQLLYSSENVKIMEEEGLVGYLTCLTWNLPKEETAELVQCIHKTFGSQNVPSLKIISKALLARACGLYKAFTL